MSQTAERTSEPEGSGSAASRPAPAPAAPPGGSSLRRELTNLPNLITIGRVLLIPPVLVLIDNYNPLRSLLAGVLYMAAAAGDFLDGYLARSRNQVSTL